MADANHNKFLARVLRQAQSEYGLITPDYSEDLPAGLVWVMVNALMAEKAQSLKKAAQTVHDFCIRRGNDIPELINGLTEDSEQLDMPEVWH
ncbi:MAG TPA: hypothetical protein VFA07_03765 [Chthonomonadaceae bacterium]|nr:hypothetical protein [Chthonomonadaceae bacterium]